MDADFYEIALKATNALIRRKFDNSYYQFSAGLSASSMMMTSVRTFSISN